MQGYHRQPFGRPGVSGTGAGVGAIGMGLLGGLTPGGGLRRAAMASVPGALMGAAAPGMAAQAGNAAAQARDSAVGMANRAYDAAPRVPRVSVKVSSVKQADMPGWAGKGLGIYGTLAGLLALGSGTAAYKFTKDRSTNKLMEDAIKQRERERWARRPPEIYAIPTPVRLTRGGDVTQSGKAPVLPGTEGTM